MAAENIMENTFAYQRLMHLSNLGFSPKTIIDIGAYHGDWADMVSMVFPDADIFMIEANADHKKILKEVDCTIGFEIALLGKKNKKKVKFYLVDSGEHSTGNSVYKENTKFFGKSKHRWLDMVTLDSLVQKRKLKNIDFIKIDTQGSELDILEGGQKTLSKCEFVLLETQNVEFNKGAPFMSDVINQMGLWGFGVYDILEIHYLPTGEMFQQDFLFVRKSSKFYRKGELIQ